MQKVVICIPAYNAETTIARTLKSLLNQDYPISKIKIFDNQSTDKTVDIIQGFISTYPNIELQVNEVNLGGEGNFTKCIQSAEEDYCLLAHTDDIYEKNFISTSVQLLERYPDCVATFCGALEIDSTEKVIGKRFYPPELLNENFSIIDKRLFLNLVFKYSNFVTCPSVVVRSRTYREGIKVWNGAKYKSSADLDVWFRLTEIGNIIGIQSPLIRYRVAEVSHSYRVAKKRITRHDLFLVLDYYRQKYQTALSEADEQNYYFLNLKDQAIRSLNIFRNKLKEEVLPNEYAFNLDIVARRMLLSKWHFKMGVSIIGIYLLTQVAVFFGWGKPCKK